MEYRRIGVLAGIVSTLGIVVQYVPSAVLNRWINSGLDGAIPTIGTVGQTVTIYSLIVESTGVLVTFLLAICFGYYASRQLDIVQEYRRFGTVVAVGSLVSVVLVWAVWMYGVQSTPMTASSVLLTLAVFVRMVVAISVIVTVGAFAGAALSHLRSTKKAPAQPTGADRDSSVTQQSSTDSSGAQSSSV